ncbi:Endoribonuclease Dicer [Trichinella nelsoni]|uniref:Small ribosomal subunit protein eS7 n=1 Tax=Trichinella nelsoni TaxID=6336 RepID=A0A0V0RT51_9BILA|nr:Endoribonuclease Dicer [Trichinella nelsoni]
MGMAASSTNGDAMEDESEMEAFDVVRIADDVIQRLRFGSQDIFKSEDPVIDDMLIESAYRIQYETLRQDLIATQEEVARLKRQLQERDYAERKKHHSESHKSRKTFKRGEAEQLKLEQKLKSTVQDVKTKFMQYSCHQLCMDKEMEVMKCFDLNRQKTLKCSKLVSEFINCINSETQQRIGRMVVVLLYHLHGKLLLILEFMFTNSAAFCKNNIDMVYGTLNNLVRASKDSVTDLERQVSQVLYDLKHSQDLQYYVKEDLTFVSAKEIDVGNRAVIIVFVPFPQYKQYRRILVRLIHEVEKKFGGKHVVFVAKRRILPKPTRGKRKITQKQKRPRSRTLAAVHDEYLNDIVFPAEIVGKRIRVRLDGSRLLKVHLDRNQKAAVEHKQNGERTKRSKELLECAKKENVIVTLGTGTGKTFIAVMLIREMSESVHQPLKEGGKRSFFIVDKVPLVKQQAEHIRINTNLKVGEFHGALGVDFWSAKIWMEFFDKFHVLVMTAEIFRNILAHGFIKFDIVNLIVFDECHHATKQHPYKKIMELYKLCYNNNNSGIQPRILGLTASVMNKKGDEIGLQKAIRNLETTLCSRVVGTSHAELLKFYSADPHIAIVACKNDNKYDWHELDLFFQHLVRSTQKSLERCGRDCEGNESLYIQHVCDVLAKLDSIMGQLGPWCALQVCKQMLQSTTKLATRISTLLADDEDNNLFSLLTSGSDASRSVWLEVLKTCLKVTSVKLKRHIGLVDSVQKLKCVVSDRLSALLNILDSENGSSFVNNLLTSSNKPFGIVFVNQRLVAYCIAILIDTAKKLQPRSYSYLEVDYVVGSRMSAEVVEPSYARQEEVLKNFRHGKLNLLVATSILEEGIDVRHCNYVIRFDTPLTFRSFVQSKGRARQKIAYYTILVQDRFLESFQEMLNSFVETEKFLKVNGRDLNILTRTKDRDHSYSGNNDQVDNCRKEVNLPNGDVDSLVEPYYTYFEENGTVKKAACLVLSSAHNVIKRYCNKLRKDRFSDSSPKFSVQTILNKDLSISYVATVQLPTTSPLKKKIEGKPMQNAKLAEMAAAFETAKMLHAMSELNEFLIPPVTVRKEIELKEDEEFFSISSRSYYLKEVPDVLYKAIPRADQKSYLYAISISSIESFLPRLGILVSKPIGNLPRFSVFTDESYIDVEIEFVEETSYSAHQLDILTSFHCCLFKNYLFSEETDFIFDPENAACSYLIVPLKCEYNSKCSVDLSTAEKIINWSKDVSHIPQQRSEKFIMNSSSYFNAVVYPWYKNKDDRDFYYFVTAVDNTCTPMSPFPFKMYRSFAEYFEVAKQVKVLDKNQPLLSVKMVSFKRLNLLCEKQISILLFDFDDDTNSSHCKVVPELVVIHPMPASMWRCLIFLPTVLYRMNHLLIAEQLRLQILREAMFPGEVLEGNCEIQPLNKDWYLLASRLNDMCIVDNQLPVKLSKLQVNSNSAAAATATGSIDPETQALLEEFDVRFCNACPTVPVDDQLDILTGNSVAESHKAESNDECLFDTQFSLQLLSSIQPQQQPLENVDFGIVESDGESDFVAAPALPESELNLFVEPSDVSDTATAPAQHCPGPQCRDVLRALTLRSAQDMFDLESMEALGDSFLKFIVSLHVFKKETSWNEGRLTSLRSEIVSNTNLFNLGKKKLLQAKLTAVPFDPTAQWLPPCFRSLAALESGYESVKELIDEGASKKKKQALKAKTLAPVVVAECYEMCSLNRTHQMIYDKSIADCVEALVGCYLLEAGMRPAIKLLKWFGIDIDDNLMNLLSSSSSSVFCSENCVLIGPEAKIHSIWTAYDLNSFEAKLGYRFTNKAYLIQALTHSSYNEVETPVTDSYERLEFLGDAILDYLISRHLYSSKRIRSPGLLSDLRSALVNNVFFASMAVLNHFQKYFLYFNAELLTVNERFVLAMRGLKESVNFHNELYMMEEEQDDDEKETSKFAEHVEVPKPLGDIFESVAGAIFLDSHCSLATVWQVYYNMLAEEIGKQPSDFTSFNKCLCHPPISPVRHLLELEPERVQFNILDREEGNSGVHVQVVVTGKGRFIGSGKSYRTAKHAAAKKALRELHPTSNHFII